MTVGCRRGSGIAGAAGYVGRADYGPPVNARPMADPKRVNAPAVVLPASTVLLPMALPA
jgi:hypothetical protein